MSDGVMGVIKLIRIERICTAFRECFSGYERKIR